MINITTANAAKREVFGYDFEVLSNIGWWCVTFIENSTGDTITIVNNRQALVDFYNAHINDIVVGYNSRNYDQFIYKGTIDKLNPGNVNDDLIKYGKRGYQVVKNAKKYHLNNYDCILKDKSLKQLEGYMGSKIKESSVDFDIDRPLTAEEEQEIIEYNIHDVKEMLKVFNLTKGDFDAQLEVINMFDLDMDKFNLTKAQLAAHVLGAEKQHTLDDEFEFTVPPNLDMPDKYQHIVDWYFNPFNKSYKLPLKDNIASNSTRQLKTMVGGVPCYYGYGGLHGSRDNIIEEGIFVLADVASLYPSLMINENYYSRKLKNPNVFKEIKDRRLELKKKGDPRQKPLKIVINSAYGILKDRNSACFDPLMSNQVCLAGQWYLTDLASRLEDKSKILQINTDGIYVKVESMKVANEIVEIIHDFEKRTKLDFDVDIYEHGKLIQKDVNNYILINEDTGKVKRKGAYVKNLSPIDNDLPIVNKALVDYFVKDVPVEDTINNAKELIDFQKIIKLTSKYKEVVYGDATTVKVKNKDKTVVTDGTPLREKVHRVFASTRPEDKGIYKVKHEKGEKIYEKVPYTPTKCFIDNDEVIRKPIPEYLDRQYYIDLAKDRIEQFLTPEVEKIDDTPNILYQCMCDNENDFIGFLADAKKNGITKKLLEGYIKANCCEVYGKTKKLLEFMTYFNMLWEKKRFTKKTLEKKITDKNVLNLIISNCTLSKTGKTYSDFDYETTLKSIFDYLPDEHIHSYEIVAEQLKKFNEPRYVDKSMPKNRWMVFNVRDIIAPNIIIYNFYSGEVKYQKVDKKIYKIIPMVNGDIIDITKTEMRYGEKIIGKDDNGLNIIAADIDKEYEVITGYEFYYVAKDKNRNEMLKGVDVS